MQTTTMMKTNNNVPQLYSKESLRLEQRRLKLEIKTQEEALRQRVQKLPGELLYASVDAVLPPVLTGKISHKILNFGRNFVNKSVVKKTSGNTSRLVTAAKQAGIVTLIRIAYKAFIKKK